MKTHLFFWVLFLFTISIHAQVIVKENKLWSNTSQGTSGPAPYESYYIKFEEDTTINDLIYKKIWRCNDSLQSAWFLNGYIREDSTKKVFIYDEIENEDIVLYDFGLEEGDSIYDGQYLFEHVDSVFYITLENSTDSSRVITFKYWHGAWIEGVGSTLGILEGINRMRITGRYSWLTCYFENDTLKYHEPEFSTCFPSGFPDGINQLNSSQIEIKISNHESIINIDFSDFSTVNTTLVVYNINGSCAKEINLNGENSISFSKTGFRPGIYFYQLEMRIPFCLTNS